MKPPKKILLITLSNLGDVILTLPVLDALCANFPQAAVTVMVGPRAKEIFSNAASRFEIIVYDKHARLSEKTKLFFRLKRANFDAVLDYRNSLYGALLPCRWRTSPFLIIPGRIKHMKERNLYRLKNALPQLDLSLKPKNPSFSYSDQDKSYIDELLLARRVRRDEKIVLVSTGAGGGTRKWEADKFASLCCDLSAFARVAVIGSAAFSDTNRYIAGRCPDKVLDLTGLTSLRQLAYLLKRSAALVSCDTGTLQLASYMDIPTVALFGPSDEKKYGPWSSGSMVIKRELFCRPCTVAQCRYKDARCMSFLKPQEVLERVRDILSDKAAACIRPAQDSGPKRILIIRTDRIGDVVLSTPVIKAVRQKYPQAYLAMMVSAVAGDIVAGNPYLDEVVLLDKRSRDRGLLGALRISRRIKREKFDLAIVLHPTIRAHLLSFLAGIPQRIGYDRKWAFLLTQKIAHKKQEGLRHESDYNFDLVRQLGIDGQNKEFYVPIKPGAESWLSQLLERSGIKQEDRLLCVHPGASCLSKIWPAERFALVADSLADEYGFKPVIVAGSSDAAQAATVERAMRHNVLNLAGRTSLAQLASVLKRSSIFISNDSGPVHIACALGVPVVSIFGRDQKGLSPRRWGPCAENGIYVHKGGGCLPCLAHECANGFKCLKNITVDDVLEAARKALDR